MGSAKDFRLTPEESASVREALRAFMLAHPVDAAAAARVSGPMLGLSAMRESILAWLRRPFPAVAVTASLLLSMSGTAAYAAESALPGDMLYPVKIHVNESVRASLAVSAEAEAAVRASIAEERLREAEKLAADGRLSAEARARLASDFERQHTLAKELIGRVAARDAAAGADLDVRLEGSIEAHRLVLATLGDETIVASADEQSTAGSTVDTRDDRKQPGEQMAARRIVEPKGGDASARGRLTVDPSPASVAESSTVAEWSIKAATKRIESARVIHAETAQQDAALPLSAAKQHIERAARNLDDARDKLGKGRPEEATALARTAEKSAQQAIVLSRVEKDIRLRIPAMKDDADVATSKDKQQSRGAASSASSVKTKVDVQMDGRTELEIQLP